MSDPWKLQVVWQRLIEKETMQYATFAEQQRRQQQEEAAAEAALLGVACQSAQTDEDLSEEPSLRKYKSRKQRRSAAKSDATLKDRINQLPIACSSTGTLQHQQK
ncbi:hypothetical protein Pmar_PMAR011839 [Perkinsus marinus ATCC 50983]|uniref:Uncharacterized protein n=1 Tax=Perkinsus marinus (strain ATCC 50983 / TXsc) TaxID=423536 RepID=C5LBG9_PERM5|nr:hypothetical protein Pmar_PMAR011839 [Perkinsus marinus ATCC 50983]EER05790.1 hypothetical protein Pmar_PMAR011839 [Perkinsus marinus ATCC 50983]|eukprot:XP_002773974.1 hypothetical protein Pmar_PMAR011839 [Perkinsus marinus ATCC 50983]